MSALVRHHAYDHVCESSGVTNTPQNNPSLPVSSPDSNADDIAIDVEQKWTLSVRKKLNSAAPKPLRQWTIFRVPQHIRRGDGEAYAPLVVSIGPYYWLNTSISKHHKWQRVRYLLSRHRSPERASELLDRCLSKLRALDTKVRSCYSDDVHRDEQDLAYAKTPLEWIPTVTELMRGGIKFKTNGAAGSFLDVSFKDGIMAIPPLRVYDYTNPLFRNLIAFEQCYPNTRTYITIYAAFMDCIIDDAEDVKLLDSKGILVNRLSTDEAVADLFNKLCDQIHYASDRNYLADVFVRVTEYHQSKWPRWRAELIRDYFSSPWVGVAVAAAILLFLLTMEQSVFAALSYFRPP